MALIEIEKIKIINDNPRKHYDLQKLNELAESIKERGVLQPIICKQIGAEYVLIAGERRLRAAKLVGLKEIPVILSFTDNNEIKFDQVIENLQREDLSAEDKYMAFKQMHDKGWSIKEISKKTGVNTSSISSILTLENLANQIRERNDIDEYPKQLLAKTPVYIQEILAERIACGELGIRCLLADIIPTLNKVTKETIFSENEKIQIITRIAKETIFKKYPANGILAQELGKKKMELKGITPKIVSNNTLEDFIKKSKNYLNTLYEIESTRLEYLDKSLVMNLYTVLKNIDNNIRILTTTREK